MNYGKRKCEFMKNDNTLTTFALNSFLSSGHNVHTIIIYNIVSRGFQFPFSFQDTLRLIQTLIDP